MNARPIARALPNPRPDWIANAMLVSAGILISAIPSIALHPGIFVAFLLGHLIWGVVGLSRQEPALVLLNFALAVIDGYAIAQRTTLGWQ